jgi:hypothetical protein
MPRDGRVDAYIAAAQPFAQPVLAHVRSLMHQHCPAVEEAIKWGFPAFLHNGAIVATIAAFKGHASFGFWYGKMVTGETGHEGPGMGSFGRLTALADLPDDDAIAAMVAQSVTLIDAGVKPPHYADKKPPKPEAEVPPALAAALAADRAANAVWNAFAPGQRREYCEWIAEAKRDQTRDKRIAQAIEWIAQGKKRNWKYENC